MILYQNTDFSEDSILIQFFETQKKKFLVLMCICMHVHSQNKRHAKFRILHTLEKMFYVILSSFHG